MKKTRGISIFSWVLQMDLTCSGLRLDLPDQTAPWFCEPEKNNDDQKSIKSSLSSHLANEVNEPLSWLGHALLRPICNQSEVRIIKKGQSETSIIIMSHSEACVIKVSQSGACSIVVSQSGANIEYYRSKPFRGQVIYNVDSTYLWTGTGGWSDSVRPWHLLPGKETKM